MLCPGCGHGENPADALYCEQCGRPLTAASAADSAADSAAGPAPAGAASTVSAPTSPPMAAAAATTVQGEPAVDLFDAPTRELTALRPAAATGWTCACGQANPADEAYCVACGEQRPAVAELAPGATVAGFEVVERLDEGSYRVRALNGSAADGACTLICGAAERVSELVDVLHVLAAGDGTSAVMMPAVVAGGNDPACGTYAVLLAPAGKWLPYSEQPLDATAARGALEQLLTLAGRAAGAGRLLLLTPAQVLRDGSRLMVARPAAPKLPLRAPLLADPAFLPPELRSGGAGGGDIDAWRAGAYAAAATVRAATGAALGFPAGWHEAMRRLLAAAPAERPATLDEALAALRATADRRFVSAHRTAFRTDVGHHHPVNQDAGGVWTWLRWDFTPVTLAVVADGVSAGAHSEEASALAVELLHQTFEQHWRDHDFDAERAQQLLIASGLEAQRQITAMPYDNLDDANATTLVAVCVLGGTATGIWCGDSRAYGVTPEGCRALTKDHSWVNIMVDSGRMTLAKAKADPRAHVIARWLGLSEPPRDDPGFDRFSCELASGDRLLVCSDGLYMYFDQQYGSEAELAAHVFEHGDDVTAVVEKLVQTALDRGGLDNITAVLVALE